MKLGALIALILFSSCGRVPTRPDIATCTFVYKEPESLSFFTCYRPSTGEEYDLSLKEANKTRGVSASDWSLLMIYVKQLEYTLRGRSGAKARYQINKAKRDFRLN